MPIKRYFVEFFIALAAYLVAVLVSTHFLADAPEGAGKISLALVPVIPLVAMALVAIRQLGRMDEMGRKIQLEALGIAFICTALITFSYGFLETAGLPRLSMFFVWPVMGGIWAIATVIGARRYR
ncbi:hypothetical protein [Pseudomonas sp. LG1D9]|uniref:hypothetical protein n=1 Tax=Pseudomonas sp. LG1D9 TaxID=2083054 RepID=UPI000CF33786|nr:hypothetical protein [Pseudomonas sp. LG1D9]